MAIYLGNNKVSLISGCSVTGMKSYFENGGKCSGNVTNLTNILKYEDTENVTDLSEMFSNCEKLKAIPLLNTSKANEYVQNVR